MGTTPSRAAQGVGAVTTAPTRLASKLRLLTSSPWVAFAIKRIIALAVTAFVAIVITFAVVVLIPGDAAALAAGPDASPAQIEQVREALGLTKSIPDRFFSYIGGILQGDFGQSFSISGPVLSILLARLPFTLSLAGIAIAIVLLVAIPLGVTVGALTRNGRRPWLDNVFGFGTGLLMSLPPYVKATLLVLLFVIALKVLPPAYSRNNVALSMILPVLALVLGPISSISRVVRRETAVVLSQDYVRTARGWRLRTVTVYLKYVLRNTLTSALTLSGIILSGMIGGAVIIETIFNWPGLGLAVVQAIANRDYPLIQGLILFLTMISAFLILIVDIILGLIDPRTLGSKR